MHADCRHGENVCRIVSWCCCHHQCVLRGSSVTRVILVIRRVIDFVIHDQTSSRTHYYRVLYCASLCTCLEWRACENVRRATQSASSHRFFPGGFSVVGVAVTLLCHERPDQMKIDRSKCLKTINRPSASCCPETCSCK